MKLIFHGGAQEVGRSCIELITNHGDQYLLDAGIKFKDNGYDYPKVIDELKGLDGLFLSHAHLDHCGALPLLFHKRLLPPIFATQPTMAITKILLKDSYKIARIKHLNPAYERRDVRRSVKRARLVKFDREYDFRKIKFKFFNAGHIPGSSSILLESDNKKILYTGDINTRETKLMVSADPKKLPKDIDVLIIESTYGYRPLPTVNEVSKDLVAEIKTIIANGGNVIIPTFALGRAQELLIILSELYQDKSFRAPLYFDGMCNKITRKILTGTGKYLKNQKVLSKMFFIKSKFVRSQNERNRIATSKIPKIILTTSGMVQGGPVMHYIKHMWHNHKNAIFLVGYQCNGTNGRMLLDEKKVYIKGWKTEVKCQVKQFAFSGHLGKEQIFDYIKTINPKTLIVQHGDQEAITEVCNWAKSNMPDAKVYGPKVGDEIEF